jgi:ATP-dependent Clp protease ATP-binding subunit ClpX
VTTALTDLSVSALVEILTKPKNAICKQYEKLFEMEGVELEFTPEALQKIAEMALEHNTGARGLRSIMEKMMLPIMYHLPDQVGLEKCIITEVVLTEKKDPKFIYQELKKESIV